MNLNPIGSLTRLARKLNKNVTNMKISGFPRMLLFIYITLFLGSGLLYIGGLITEFWVSTKLNYSAAIQFIQIYFGTTNVVTFGILGKALIDKDSDGIPDLWEQELENNKYQSQMTKNNNLMRPQNLNTQIPISNIETDGEAPKVKRGDV